MAEAATIVGLMLTIVAFFLAIYQTRQASAQEAALKDHERALGTIASSLSTRYIGPFPDYLSTVIGVIDRAKSDLLLVNDNPVPGYFSTPLNWIDYRRAIDYRLHSGVSVTLISPSSSRRLQRMRDQFSDNVSNWPDWCASNDALVSSFMKTQYPAVSMTDVDAQRFMSMLVATQERLTNEVFSHANRIEVDDIVALQVWIADRNEAVFAIETTAEHSLSHGLYTSDPKFIAALYSMADLYRQPHRSTGP